MATYFNVFSTKKTTKKTTPNKLLRKKITWLVDEDLDCFFKRFLRDHYEKRRQALRESKQHIDVIPAIDYIMKTFIDDTSSYPPESVLQWHDCFSKLGDLNKVFQRLLVIYLRLDITNYLAIRERESSTGKSTRLKEKSELSVLERALKRLNNVPCMYDFAIPDLKLGTGLWALDNEQIGLMVFSLSDPVINLSNYFESPRELMRNIIGALHQSENCRIALYMSRIHRYEQSDEDYDQLYVYLLLASGQIVEALKYERVFADQDNYTEVLHHFFELCSRLDVTKALNCLNLSIEEEEILNQHLVIESSRPVTPASTVGSNVYYQTKRVTISDSTTTKTPTRQNKQSVHTPRNRSVQQLRKMPSFSDSPARNTRLARKKKVEH